MFIYWGIHFPPKSWKSAGIKCHEFGGTVGDFQQTSRCPKQSANALSPILWTITRLLSIFDHIFPAFFKLRVIRVLDPHSHGGCYFLFPKSLGGDPGQNLFFIFLLIGNFALCVLKGIWRLLVNFCFCVKKVPSFGNLNWVQVSNSF